MPSKSVDTPTKKVGTPTNLLGVLSKMGVCSLNCVGLFIKLCQRGKVKKNNFTTPNTDKRMDNKEFNYNNFEQEAIEQLRQGKSLSGEYRIFS